MQEAHRDTGREPTWHASCVNSFMSEPEYPSVRSTILHRSESDSADLTLRGGWLQERIREGRGGEGG